MIDIRAMNRQLVAENEALRAALATLGGVSGVDPSTKALIDVLCAGLLAIHERQGLAISTHLQTAS